MVGDPGAASGQQGVTVRFVERQQPVVGYRVRPAVAAGDEQQDDGQVRQASGHQGQQPGGGSVARVEVVHGAQQRTVVSGLGEQTEHGVGEHELVLVATAFAGHRPAQHLPVPFGQRARAVEHRTEQPLQPGVGQRGLVGQAGGGEQATIPTVPVGVRQQRAAPGAGLAVQQQRSPGRCREQPADLPTLRLPAP